MRVLEINGKDEVIYDLQDIVSIIRRHYNKDLAIEMKELIEEQESEIERLEYKIERLVDIIEE